MRIRPFKPESRGLILNFGPCGPIFYFCMHRNTKLTEPLRREVFLRWEGEKISIRELAREYHVDKRVIQRVVERGKDGDFSVRKSVNHRYLTSSKING